MRHERTATAFLIALGCVGCDTADVVGGGDGALEVECSIPLPDIHRGALRGVIPALTDPRDRDRFDRQLPHRQEGVGARLCRLGGFREFDDRAGRRHSSRSR